MKTKKYNREMITLGRQLAGCTRSELAKRCGISQPSITRMENGDRAITEEAANAIADAIDRPLSFLMWEGEIFAGSLVFHRRRASTRVRDVERTNAFINFARLRIERMIDGARIKTRRKMHRIDVGKHCTPADAARQIRAVWQVPAGPIANLVELVESAGIAIWQTDELAGEVDALSLWPVGEDDTSPVVVQVSGKSGDRERFTLAHELGHLCLHHLPANDFEDEANRFAAEFLMPEDDIRSSLQAMTLQKAAALKGKWKASMQAIIRRSFDLEVISESQYRRLNKELSMKGYKKREPVLIPSEEPQLVRAISNRFAQRVDKSGLESEFLGGKARPVKSVGTGRKSKNVQPNKRTNLLRIVS